MRTGTDDNDMAQVASAPADRAQRDAYRGARQCMGERSAHHPQQRPAARDLRTGLGQEQEQTACHGDGAPGEEQLSHFLGKGDATL